MPQGKEPLYMGRCWQHPFSIHHSSVPEPLETICDEFRKKLGSEIQMGRNWKRAKLGNQTRIY